MVLQNKIMVKIKGSKIDVVCARVGGANTTPLLNSAAHFAKQKIIIGFLFLQNTNSGGKKEKVPNPARIPPQTPPAGGKRVEAGRIHIPSQMFRPAESILILLEKGSRKVYNYSTIKNTYHKG